MYGYKIGDAIIVRNNCQWNDQRGWTGIVHGFSTNYIRCLMDVPESRGRNRFYKPNEIELWKSQFSDIMVDPEFSLDEITLAEELINGR